MVSVLVNVLLNAVHASPHREEIEVASSKRGGMVGVRIADHGSGMSDEILGRIFDPFFTTKGDGEGTGLGLSITLGIVEANHGRLDVTSQEGQGTVVTLWLPPEGRV